MANSICFILPDGEYSPTGGAKIVFEYAKCFADAGYSAIIGFCIPHMNIQRARIYNNLKTIYYEVKYKIFRKFTLKKWFKLSKLVSHVVLFKSPKKAKKVLKNFNHICVTALETTFYVASIPDISTVNKIYLIQGFEACGGVTEESVFSSYKLPLKKKCIVPWLLEKVRNIEEDAISIPNGFEFKYFSLSTPIDTRNPYTVFLLNHNDDVIKRVSNSIAVLKIVKRSCPELIVNMFGIPERPNDLSDWFHYYQQSNRQIHNEIYNNSAIFIAGSSTEGMALPPAEAIICGCALVCTNIGGFELYAKNNETALTFNVGDIEAYAKKILFLEVNNDERIKLAKKGNSFIHQFTWDTTFSNFEYFINGVRKK